MSDHVWDGMREQALKQVARAVAERDRREESVARAIRAAWEVGCPAERIAEKAGVSRSTLYRRYR